MVTVFTATFNRAHLLPQLFESLCTQTDKDFEWLIVDDGSTDNTEATVLQFIEAGKIDIRYFKQENGGKHRAINKGVKEAKGELFFIVDSDDSIINYAIKEIESVWNKVKHNECLGGICCYMSHRDGTIIGHGGDMENTIATSLEMRYKYNIVGDMAEVFKTEVLREFPFPEIEGEKFCPEALIWNRIAQKYALYCISKVIYYRDYLTGGLTSKIIRIRMESPVASTTHYKELNSYNIPLKEKFKAAINYWRFWFCKSSLKKPMIPCYWWSCFLIGLLFHFRDKYIS